MGDQLDTQVMGTLDGDVGVAGQHLALEGLQTGSHPAADLADPDHPGHFTFQFMAGKGGTLPFTRFQTAVGHRHVAAEGEQKRHGMLGGTVRIAEGCVDDDHPF